MIQKGSFLRLRRMDRSHRQFLGLKLAEYFLGERFLAVLRYLQADLPTNISLQGLLSHQYLIL